MNMYLHKKHGLNPTMDTCFYCGQAKDILLIGAKVSKFQEADLADSTGKMNMQIGVMNMEPCGKCAEYMKQGIILISCKDDKDPKNPYRTGGWVVIKEEALNKMIDTELFEDIKKRRFVFMPDEAWDKMGLPRGKVEGIPSE